MPEERWIYTGLAVGFYILALSLITWSARLREGGEGYIIGGRKVGVWGTALSQLVSITDGTGLMAVIAIVGMIGFGFTWGVAGMVVAYAVLALIAPRARRLAGERNYVTLSDMLKDRIGPDLEKVSAFVIIITAFLAMAGQLHVAGTMLAEFAGIGSTYGITLTAFIVGAYLWIGGYVSVIRTDMFQGAMIVVLALTALFYAQYPTLEEVGTDMAALPVTEAAGLFAFMVFINFAYYETWQRLFSARDPATARRATGMNIILNAIIWSGIILFATTMAGLHPDIPAADLPYESFSNPDIMPAIGAAVGVALLALIMSSIDSRAYMVASTLASNVFRLEADTGNMAFVRLLRITVIVMFIALAVIAANIGDFVQFMINVASIFSIFAPVFLASLFYTCRSRIYDRAMCGVLGVSLIFWSGMYYGGLFQGFAMNTVPVFTCAGLCLILMSVDHVLSRRRKGVS